MEPASRPPIIAVFGASAARPGDGSYENGIECGRLLVESGYAVATGGYGGIMEAVSRGARLAGGTVIGVTVPDAFPDRAGPNDFVLEEWATPHLVERIHRLTDLTAGSIVLPGSLGTLAELVVAWNLAYVARHSDTRPKPVVAVGSTWHAIIELLADRIGADLAQVTLAADVADAVVIISERVPTSSAT